MRRARRRARRAARHRLGGRRLRATSRDPSPAPANLTHRSTLSWAGHLPSRPVDLERVLMHIMRTLDAHVHGGYIIVYVHTSLTPENEPSFAWLRKVYDLFDRRLKDNLHLLYIVHPSWWLRMAMNFMKTFVASGRMMDSKIIQLQHFADLFTRNYFTPGLAGFAAGAQVPRNVRRRPPARLDHGRRGGARGPRRGARPRP